MVHLVAAVENVYIDLGHAMGKMIVKITVMKMYQTIQHVVCTLIIALKQLLIDVSYSVCFSIILKSMYPQVCSTNIASTAQQQ